MKAVRLHEFKQPLRLEEVPVPKVEGEAVLVKVVATGVCHTDLHIAAGHLKQYGIPSKLPLTLGHECAGLVEETGPGVMGFKRRDPVIVTGLWGDLTCRFCRGGNENLCDSATWPGFGIANRFYHGAYSEYFFVPTHRYLVKAGGVQLPNVAPLACGGVAAYNAFRKAAPKLHSESWAAVIGVGGLGSFAVQYLKALTPANVVAVDVAESKLRFAEKLGADCMVNAQKTKPEEEVKKITKGKGANAVMDFVASDKTLTRAVEMLAKNGKLLIIGGGAGTIHLQSVPALIGEWEVSGVNLGTLNDLRDTLALVKQGKVKSTVTKYKLADANEAHEALKQGEVEGRAVLTP